MFSCYFFTQIKRGRMPSLTFYSVSLTFLIPNAILRINDHTLGLSSTTTFICYLPQEIQVMINTTAAITHITLVGKTDAVMSPAPKVIAPKHLEHDLIFITSFLSYTFGDKMLLFDFKL